MGKLANRTTSQINGISHAEASEMHQQVVDSIAESDSLVDELKGINDDLDDLEDKVDTCNRYKKSIAIKINRIRSKMQ